MVEVTFTLALSMDDIDEDFKASFEANLRIASGCEVPDCLLKVTYRPSSVAAVSEMVIPDSSANQGTTLTNIQSAVSNLVAQPVANQGLALGLPSTAIAAVSGVTTASRSVPVLFQPPPPPPSPPPLPPPAPPSPPSAPPPPWPPLHERCGCTLTLDCAVHSHSKICVKTTMSAGRTNHECKAAHGYRAQCPSDYRMCDFDALNAAALAGDTCQDKKPEKRCIRKRSKGKCANTGKMMKRMKKKCEKTCGYCFAR